MLSFTFIITSLIVVLIPGTGVIYTISTGITRGKRSSIYAAMGCTAGIIPHMAVGILALVLFQEVNELIFNIVKSVGAVYLIFMGITMIKSGPSIKPGETAIASSGLGIAMKGVLINLLNPKLSVFFLAFIPQYVSGNDVNTVIQGIKLGLLFMLLTLFVFIIYGLIAGIGHSFIENSSRRVIMIQRVFGVVFIILAVQLLLSRL